MTAGLGMLASGGHDACYRIGKLIVKRKIYMVGEKREIRPANSVQSSAGMRGKREKSKSAPSKT